MLLIGFRIKIGEQADRDVTGFRASQLVHGRVRVRDICGPKEPRLGDAHFPLCPNPGLSPDASDGQEQGSVGLASHILRLWVEKNILETSSKWTGSQGQAKAMGPGQEARFSVAALWLALPGIQGNQKCRAP